MTADDVAELVVLRLAMLRDINPDVVSDVRRLEVYAPHNYAGAGIRLAWPESRRDPTVIGIGNTSVDIQNPLEVARWLRDTLSWFPIPTTREAADRAVSVCLDIVEASEELAIQVTAEVDAVTRVTKPPLRQPPPQDAGALLEALTAMIRMAGEQAPG